MHRFDLRYYASFLRDVINYVQNFVIQKKMDSMEKLIDIETAKIDQKNLDILTELLHSLEQVIARFWNNAVKNLDDFFQHLSNLHRNLDEPDEEKITKLMFVA